MTTDTAERDMQPFHLSVFIREELDARSWTLDNLAVKMGGDFSMNRLALDFYMEIGANNPTMRIGKDTAKRIAVALGVSTQYILGLEAAWLGAQND